MKKHLTLLACLIVMSSCSTKNSEGPPFTNEFKGDNKEEALEQGPIYASFTLNTQEFMTPDLSLEVIERLVELHEDYSIPVDIFFADFLVQTLDETEIFEELADNDLVAISYHVRQPMPQAGGYTTLDWDSMKYEERYENYLAYESFTIDPESAELSSAPGGYSYLKELIGYAPYAVGLPLEDDALIDVYESMGAQYAANHTKDSFMLNEPIGELMYRPETFEVPLYKLDIEKLEKKLDDILSRESDEPIFINFKIHDKDFFADASAWTLIYVHHKPPYDLEGFYSEVNFLTEEEQESIWELYEYALDYIDSHNEIWAINLNELTEIVDF